MSRFFFDVHDGAMHLDEFGMESANMEAARCIALRLLSELNRDEVAKGCDRYAIDLPPRGGPSSKLVQGRPLLYG
ncbi:DUF6894 family protein [Methylobacterium phyllosphaerae]